MKVFPLLLKGLGIGTSCLMGGSGVGSGTLAFATADTSAQMTLARRSARVDRRSKDCTL
jgi:hypothetical protein